MPSSSRDRWLTINYAAAIFTSAFLLFQIQPLITKHILPWFGGGPAVWTTCLLFFQTLLFAGYAYAHFIHGRLQPRRQALVHGALILAAIAFVGVLPGSRWEPGGQDEPIPRILMILTVSVGLPYFVLSATGPLLQAWFARSFPGRSPYRLYALSNVGSLLALVSYPFFFERLFNLPRQAGIWSAGFVVYAMLCGFAAWRLWTSDRVPSKRERKARKELPPMDPAATPPLSHRLLWLVLPAFASIVLMATTNHISTDIAVMPFLWIAPLALYLVTFIIAFDRPSWYRPTLVAAVMLAAIYGTALVHHLGVGTAKVKDAGTPGLLVSIFVPEVYIGTLLFLVINFLAMFAICMLCHGELVRLRPDPRYLTSFYLMIAAGGALGGAFVTLVAPQIFVTYYEWQLSLFIACLIGIAFVLRGFINVLFGDDEMARGRWRYAILAGLVWVVFLPSAVMLLDLVEFLQPSTGKSEFRTRNFFGTLAVFERGEDKPLTHCYVLRHGAINHGAQFTHETRRGEPTTYYARNSGVARAIDYYRRKLESSRMNLGVVGLGTGTLAAYVDGGDAVSFYEINQAVVEIAESGRWFTYLPDCRARGADCDTKLGDARLTLRRELRHDSPPRSGEGLGEGYHLLVLDAFSGDSIPVHLLTVEAFELYLAHLVRPIAPDPATANKQLGAIAVHISNRYLDLKPVVHGIARHFRLNAVHIESEDQTKNAIFRANWILLTGNRELAEELVHFSSIPSPGAEPILWTDTHSSLFDLLK